MVQTRAQAARTRSGASRMSFQSLPQRTRRRAAKKASMKKKSASMKMGSPRRKGDYAMCVRHSKCRRVGKRMCSRTRHMGVPCKYASGSKFSFCRKSKNKMPCH